MMVRNADMVRKAIQDEWALYVGSGNVVSNLQELLGGALTKLSNRLVASSVTSTFGRRRYTDRTIRNWFSGTASPTVRTVTST
jgi:hypothetical protein